MIFWGVENKGLWFDKKGGGDPLLLVAYFSVIENNDGWEEGIFAI